MAKYKIEYDKESCIGAFACSAVAEKFWIPTQENDKVDLKDATFNEETKKFELIIDEKDFTINHEAAEACPVLVIKIIKLEE
tara:strand:+ start:5905 stop:6150 length:246 start_codon:yes stop_codon:yes gene_type:complete